MQTEHSEDVLSKRDSAFETNSDEMTNKKQSTRNLYETKWWQFWRIFPLFQFLWVLIILWMSTSDCSDFSLDYALTYF